MQFKYIATNREGKKLTGVINAPDQTVARAQLNSLGFSILDIKTVQENGPEDPSLKKYEFEATDPNGKKIKGSIPAKTPLLAYQRLIEEYHFHVENLTPTQATQEELTQWNAGEFEKIKNEYELSHNENPKDKTMADLVESPAFVQRKQKLIEEIDAILGKIKTLLSNFSEKISPDKRAAIQGYIDKLLRIKTSNNLDYIANTCKELLGKVQAEEIFLQNQDHSVERQSLLLESQKMMMELNKAVAAPKKTPLSLKAILETAQLKLKNSPLSPLATPLQSIQSWLEVPREIEMIQTQLKAIHEQEWDALKLAIKAPKETRSTAWQELKSLREKEKEIRKKKTQLNRLRHESRKIARMTRHALLLKETNTFTGWLLTFYLAYYFWGHYVQTQGWETAPLFGIPYDLSESALYKYLLPLTFLIHAATSLKINFFSRRKGSLALLLSLSGILMLLTLFNF